MIHIANKRSFFMTQIEFALHEIEQNGNLSTKELKALKAVFSAHEKRMQQKFPNYNLFITGTGQSYGLKIQKIITDSFNDLSNLGGSGIYDATCTSNNLRIEIKSVKALKGNSNDYIGSRIINLNECAHLAGSFQQVKPLTCDWFIFHILYGNGERLFLVPSSIISKTPKMANGEVGKIALSGQHRGHKTEGQVNIGQILSRADLFEIPNYDHNKEKFYNFANLQNIICSRFRKKTSDNDEWLLPQD